MLPCPDPLRYGGLYDRPIKARRTGALFSAFPYPTKIDPEAVALYIAAHTRPGETVLDGFAGSGTTGVAALLCERPTEQMLSTAKAQGLDLEWGPRKAVLYELGVLGAFIGRTLTNPPDPERFKAAAASVLASVQDELSWMYEAQGPDGSPGQIRHTIWSDLLRCPACLKAASLWDVAVSLQPARISGQFTCPVCEYECPASEAERVTAPEADPLLDGERLVRRRVPARVYGRGSSGTWSRPPSAADLALIEKVAAVPLPASVPVWALDWGDLYRSGYHQGISHLHHFYTRRNLIVFARMWEEAAAQPAELVDGLRFWLLGYNASHATLMTRVVAKQDMPDLVVTSGQPGVLYVSGLPVEKNLFAGLRRRAKVVAEAFAQTRGCRGTVTVVNGSSRNIQLADGSVDYVFTDPPFGGNIPYAEVNSINEAWLGTATDRRDEVVVSPHQGKGTADYRALMSDVFAEFHRVLGDDGRLTVIFHSATSAIWNALSDAYRASGFKVERASVLDKLQGSFKQVTARGAVKGDPALLLCKEVEARKEVATADWRSLSREWVRAASPAAERSPQRLYSRLIGFYLAAHQQVPVSADLFYRWVAEQVEAHGLPDLAE